MSDDLQTIINNLIKEWHSLADAGVIDDRYEEFDRWMTELDNVAGEVVDAHK